MIFVDTSAWVAHFLEDDENHKDASAWMRNNKEHLITTDYIIDETLTVLRSGGENQIALNVGKMLLHTRHVKVYYLCESDIGLAWHIFERYSDKKWSFTDCTSKVIMEKLGITQAFAFDRHFTEFGTCIVVP